ncbi:MAG: RsmB/NOP family class I SAM-dependent RNA methyltransferase [Cytophagales bacterium]|nr:RsmB/NOP family class I SAM-dependent RNA methyltransferase [Cytophagales bacterium]
MHPQQLLDACTELVALVLKFEHPADAVLSHYFKDNRKLKNLGQRERAVLAETAYTVLRSKTRLEALSRAGSGALARRLAILAYPTNNPSDADFLQGALLPHEKMWLQDCKKVEGEELLDAHKHNLPAWLAESLRKELGEEQFWAFCAACETTAPLDVRVNMLNSKRDQIQTVLQKAGVKAEATPFSPMGLRMNARTALSQLAVFKAGAIEVQDEGSQLLTLLVDAKRGEMVADFCAGAGGKTLGLGAAMRSTGRLYAFDVSAHRLAALKPRLARSGLSNIHPVAIAHERDERIKRLAGKMDRVLVDAPCSGLGTLRRNPDLKWRQKQAAVSELTIKQTNILQSASRLVKSGGRLVYATCSVLPEENERIAEAFAAANPDFKLLPVQTVLSSLSIPNADTLCRNGYLRLWPHLHQTDGFFAAVWQRQ